MDLIWTSGLFSGCQATSEDVTVLRYNLRAFGIGFVCRFSNNCSAKMVHTLNSLIIKKKTMSPIIKVIYAYPILLCRRHTQYIQQQLCSWRKIAVTLDYFSDSIAKLVIWLYSCRRTTISCFHYRYSTWKLLIHLRTWNKENDIPFGASGSKKLLRYFHMRVYIEEVWSSDAKFWAKAR